MKKNTKKCKINYELLFIRDMIETNGYIQTFINNNPIHPITAKIKALTKTLNVYVDPKDYDEIKAVYAVIEVE